MATVIQLPGNALCSKLARPSSCNTSQVWDDELARVAQKWADQCADVDYLVRQGGKNNQEQHKYLLNQIAQGCRHMWFFLHSWIGFRTTRREKILTSSMTPTRKEKSVSEEFINMHEKNTEWHRSQVKGILPLILQICFKISCRYISCIQSAFYMPNSLLCMQYACNAFFLTYL